MAKKQEKQIVSRPQTFIAETRETKIYDLLVQGKSVRQIAEQFGVTEEAITTAITKERQRMSIFRQDMLERYDDLTLARTEWLLQKLLPIVEAQIENNPIAGPSRDLMNQIRDLMKFGREIVAPPKTNGEDKADAKFTINQTFVTGSSMYDEALQNMQNTVIGYTVHNVDEPTVLVQDERLVALEELASQYFPEGLLPDGISDESE